MSALRFVPFSGIVVTAGWCKPPGMYFMSVVKGRSECLYVQASELDELREKLTGIGIHNRVPAGFWRYLERQEGAVFYWWEHGQWMRLDEHVAHVMRGRAQTGRDGRTQY